MGAKYDAVLVGRRAVDHLGLLRSTLRLLSGAANAAREMRTHLVAGEPLPRGVHDELAERTAALGSFDPVTTMGKDCAERLLARAEHVELLRCVLGIAAGVGCLATSVELHLVGRLHFDPGVERRVLLRIADDVRDALRALERLETRA